MKSIALALAIAAASACSAQYSATADSLKRHQVVPEWFLDAKLGIYCHWGPYSVPAFSSEWYPRNMFIKGSPENQFHIKTFGDPAKFGYDELVRRFTAPQFDATAWADLFQKAGAKFAGPVSEHHDGFAMWDSAVTPWNSADMGPRRDITGELEKSIRARGMKFITTFHHSRNALWKQNGQWTGHYDHVLSDYPSVLNDPKLAFLYGYMDHGKFIQLWKDKLAEVIDRYKPDLIWFDSWLNEVPPADQYAFLAHYFNQARAWGKDVMVTRKNHEMPFTVEDFEKGRLDDLSSTPWLTDDTVSWGSWSYTEGLELKTAKTVIHTLVDIVSKNGVLLLNASPKADGSFPDDQVRLLTELGGWLKLNGEAIYDTRPWKVYGEGPTSMGRGGHFVGRVDYTDRDIRYTQSKDGKTLYATVLGWPKDGKVLLNALEVKGVGAKPEVRLLDDGSEVAWAKGPDGQLSATLPSRAGPTPVAISLRVRGIDLVPSPSALFGRSSTIRLTADRAVVEGGARTETFDGVTNIGYWDSSKTKVHWLASIDQPGEYLVRGSFSTVHDGASATLKSRGLSTRFEIPNNRDWRVPRWSAGQTIRVHKPGVVQFTLERGSQPLNLFSIELTRLPKERV